MNLSALGARQESCIGKSSISSICSNRTKLLKQGLSCLSDSAQTLFATVEYYSLSQGNIWINSKAHLIAERTLARLPLTSAGLQKFEHGGYICEGVRIFQAEYSQKHS